MRIIQYLLNSLLTLIFINNKSENSTKEQVRLNKVTEEKPKPNRNFLNKIKKIPINKILLIIGLITLMTLITVIIYKTGSLESTNYYYRLN